MANLRRNYVLVGMITVVIILITQGIVWFNLINDAGDALLVNLAGRQRMLSQYLTKDVLLIVYEGEGSRYAAYLDETAAALDSFERVHVGLQNGSAELGLRGELSDAVRASFVTIQPYFDTLSTSVACILSLRGYDDRVHFTLVQKEVG